MKFLFKTVFFILMLSPFVLIGLLITAPEDYPLQSNQASLSPADIRQAKQLLQQHDPRKLADDSLQTLALDEKPLNLIGTYLLQTLMNDRARSGFQANLENQRLAVQLTVLLPENPLGRYFNAAFTLATDNAMTRLSDLKIGRWNVPKFIHQYLPGLIIKLLQTQEHGRLFLSTLQNLTISNKQLLITYQWRSAWENIARQQLMALTQNKPVAIYARQLRLISQRSLRSSKVVMQRLFQLAVERTAQGHDAVTENRAVLQLLGQWALGKNHFENTRLYPFNLNFYRRRDLAQHFLVSATIASQSNVLLSNLIGTSKELHDADGGSGFSFDDLAADRAGTLFGKIAVASPESAQQLQQKMTRGISEQRLFPLPDDLPASLNDEQFHRLYGDINDPRYQKLISKIDNEIARSDFYRNFRSQN